MNHPRILVVEDECIVAEELQGTLARMGYDTVPPVVTGEDAVAAAEKFKPDLVLMDMKLLGGMNGVETAGHIRETADIPIVFLTAFADDEALREIASSEPYAGAGTRAPRNDRGGTEPAACR